MKIAAIRSYEDEILDMAGVPAKCRKCGHVFDSNFIGIDGPLTRTSDGGGSESGIFMAGNSVACPKCGSASVVANAIISSDSNGNTIRLLDPFSAKIYEQFNKLTESAVNDEITLPDYFLAASKIHPGLGEVISTASKAVAEKQGSDIVRTGAVAMILTAWLASCDVSFDVNKGIEQFQEYLRSIEVEKDSSENSPITPEKPPNAKEPNTTISVEVTKDNPSRKT